MSEDAGGGELTAAETPRPSGRPPTSRVPEGPFTKMSGLGAVAGVIVGLLGLLATLYVSGILGPAAGQQTSLAPVTQTATVEITADGDDATTSTVSKETTTAPPSTVAEGPAPEAAAVGWCLSASGERTDCAGAYDAQVVATGPPCELDELETFLGVSSDDVLRPDLVLSPTPDGSGCAASLLGGTTLTGSLEGAFADPRSVTAAQVRHCLDTNLRPTSCAGAHHGEVVGMVEDSQACLAAAATYMGQETGRLDSSLALTAWGAECRITVKGENSLNDTLREIGRRALPVEASS